jgi:hypothetical protein
MTPQNFTLTIAAGQAATNTAGGKVLTVKSCTLPLNVSTDGGGYQAIQAGAVINAGPTGFRVLNFQNPQVVAVTVVFYVGDTQVQFSAADNSTAAAATYAVGNLGIANGTGAANGNPACSAAGLLQITNGMALIIPGTDPATGHRRQHIVFSTDPAAAYNLNVLDGQGNVFMVLAKNQQILLPNDAVYKVSGVGGTVGVTIGQVYLLTN